MKISKLRRISALLFVSLLLLPLVIHLSYGATYTLTVEGYYQKPWETTRTATGIKVYLSPYGSLGGTPYTTPIAITGLDESTNYYLKVPLTAAVEAQATAIFTGLEGGTSVLTGPKQDLEMIDTDGDGAVDKPYLVYTLLNPIGSGDKLIKAVYKLQWGPQNEHLFFKTISSPTAQRIAMLNEEVDVLTDLIRDIDVNALAVGNDGIAGTADDNKITSTPGFHMCYFAFNMRKSPFGPVDGSNPGRALRQAIAYLLPKDSLIGTLFKYIVVRLDTFVPPSLASWYDPSVTIYDYNPSQANSTLYAAGYIFDARNNVWKNPSGVALPTINVMSPLYEVAPTSFTIASTLVDQMNALKLWAVHKPTDFWTLVSNVFQYHNFDMYFLCWELGRFPDFLYNFFHSSNDVEWGNNAPGIHNAALDNLLETIKFSLNHTAKLEAAKNAQAQLSTMLPYVPVYSRNYFNAQLPKAQGTVLSPGFGIKNFWTFARLRGPRLSPIVKPPSYPIQGNETIWVLGEKPETYNPAFAGSAYAWEVLNNIYDSLIMVNPFTHEDMPWLAKSWSVEGPINATAPNGGKIVNGMRITFNMDDQVVAGNVLWHDGEVFNAYDVAFAWEYVRNESIPNFMAFWEKLVDADAPNAGTAVAYFNVTSQWFLYDAASIGAMFPPQVWNAVRDNPGTPDNEVLSYKPEEHSRPNAAYPWLTEVIGTGPFVFRSYTAPDRLYTDLVAFDQRTHAPGSNMPNLHYWKTSAEVQEKMSEMFYKVGDVTLNGVVDILDLSRVGSKYGRTGFPGWRQEDVVKDGIVNILDIATAGRSYGKQREY